MCVALVTRSGRMTGNRESKAKRHVCLSGHPFFHSVKVAFMKRVRFIHSFIQSINHV